VGTFTPGPKHLHVGWYLLNATFFFIFFIYGMVAMQQTLPELTFDTVESFASVRVRDPQQLQLLIRCSYSDWLLAFSQLN